jgi:hypothetical protein
MKYLKFIILLLIFWNLPSYTLIHFNAITATILSYGTFFLIIVYYFFNKKEKPINSFILLGLLYFLISVLVDTQNAENFIVTFIKYFIFTIMGIKVAKDTTDIEIYILLLLGALSIFYEAIFIENITGRYSGFFLNPNLAGLISVLGYCFSLTTDYKKLRIIGQIVFSIAGFVTFSRTFLIIWLLINIISLSITYKNSYKILIGILLFSLFISFGDKFELSIIRFEAYSSILDGEISDEMEEDSRYETWALFYDKILEKPIFGNGYMSLSGEKLIYANSEIISVGVHNTFLLILGESGIFVFLYFTAIYGGFVVSGIRIFKNEPLILLISFSLFIYMLTSHNYFDNYLILFVSIWLWMKINRKEIIVEKK